MEAELVYANYGSPDDFDALDQIGVSVKGKVVIVRYGSSFRGLKAMNAQRRGALGVIIYSDPMEDGYAVGKTYPNGPWRPAEAVQRGSVQFNSLCAGDPARLYSNQTTLELCGYEPQDVIPSIPVLPMSWADALPLLRNLANPAGVTIPKDFQGALPLIYQTGPGPAVVTMDVNNDIRPGLIHNVYATIPGQDYGTAQDRAVVLGNHRDAWVFGAVDPNSGTAALLEVARAFGTLLRMGWKPARTIILCSWDGEEYGLLGSTAWAEMRATSLQSSAVAYLNVDVGVSGKDLSAHASPQLDPVIRAAVAALTDPSTGKPLDDVWDGEIGDLGSGSDYTVFLDRLGIPSIDLSFRHQEAPTLYGVYHSVYDSFSYMEQQVDPEFKYHALQAQLWGLIALRIASQPVLALSPLALGESLGRYVEYVKSLMRGIGCQGQCTHIIRALRARKALGHGAMLDLSALERAVADFKSAAHDPLLLHELDLCSASPRRRARRGGKKVEIEICGKVRLWRLNEALRSVEGAFLQLQGLPDRKWFRHVLQAPGLYLGYGADLFPGICQALRDGNLALAQEQVGVCALRVTAAIKALNSWKISSSSTSVPVAKASVVS